MNEGNEVILDNYSLIVSVKPDYEEKKKESLYLWINDEKTLINGKRYQSCLLYTSRCV